MKHLCEKCCNAMDGMPDIHMSGCINKTQEYNEAGEIVACTGFDELPPLQVNTRKVTDEDVDKEIALNPLMGTDADKGLIKKLLEKDLKEQGYAIAQGYTMEKSDLKPPLGAKPAIVAMEQRVKELGEAIIRMMASRKPNMQKTRIWAREIELQTKLLEELEKYEQDQLH